MFCNPRSQFSLLPQQQQQNHHQEPPPRCLGVSAPSVQIVAQNVHASPNSAMAWSGWEQGQLVGRRTVHGLQALRRSFRTGKVYVLPCQTLKIWVNFQKKKKSLLFDMGGGFLVLLKRYCRGVWALIAAAEENSIPLCQRSVWIKKKLCGVWSFLCVDWAWIDLCFFWSSSKFCHQLWCT